LRIEGDKDADGDDARPPAVMGIPRHVWVVDDDRLFLSAVTQHLSEAGYRTTGFGSSMDALARIDAGGDCDLLVADIVLGKGEPHGVSLASMMRMRRLKLKCIFVTGFPDAAARLNPLETLFEKPVDLARLTAAVHGAIGGGASPGA
jgi:DNA-binding NtrC family response regulator